jgi:polysaccharide chain length determinant protein (PEP-CTERM system associated)
MNNLIEWKAPEPRPTMLQLLPVASKEVRRHPLLLAGLFAAIALLGLFFGMTAPKAYTSSTTLLVEETNIIQPLLEGRTVPTTVVDRAGVAREVAFSRKSMDEILKAGGWLETRPDALQRAQLIDQIINRTLIANPRENLKLIQISYTDSDPQRAQAVTRRFGELIIQESFRTKERESRAAFEFIDSQVDDYQRKLNDAEDKLAAYRKEHPEVLLGDQADVTRRISDLRLEIDKSLMDQAEQQSQAGSWASHVSRERSIGAASSRTGPLQARLAELQAERIRLAGSYTDQHPDMVRIQSQIDDLQAQLRRGGLPAMAAAAPSGSSEDRGRVTEARSRSLGAASRIATGNNLLAQEMERLNRVAALGSELANLTRDFEVNRDLYQDLLERRENARMAMNLDIQRGGLNFRVQEPATLPLQSSSMSLANFSMAVLILAIAAPVLLLLAWLRLDPRVRSPSQIESIAGLPVLASIPPGTNRRSRQRNRQRLALATALLLAVPIAYAVAFTLK